MSSPRRTLRTLGSVHRWASCRTGLRATTRRRSLAGRIAGSVLGFGRVSDGSNRPFRRRRGVGRTNREGTRYSVVHLNLSFFGAVRGWCEAARRAPTGGSIATDRKAIRPRRNRPISTYKGAQPLLTLTPWENDGTRNPGTATFVIPSRPRDWVAIVRQYPQSTCAFLCQRRSGRP